MGKPTPPSTLLGRGSWAEASRVADILRKETVGGALLLAATVVAMVWVNSPHVDSLRSATTRSAPNPCICTWRWGLGPPTVFSRYSSSSSVSNLKREFVAGDLRDPRRAALPILAAVGGMVAPALVYLTINLNTGDGALRGWAIATATDIAFAVTILAVVGTHVPAALRTFLLTLAVVDDLFAVTIIAVFYTSGHHLVPLLGALAPLALFTLAVQRGSGPGGCCCHWPRRPGLSSTPPVSMPPSPVSSWGSLYPCSAATP